MDLNIKKTKSDFPIQCCIITQVISIPSQEVLRTLDSENKEVTIENQESFFNCISKLGEENRANIDKAVMEDSSETTIKKLIKL